MKVPFMDLSGSFNEIYDEIIESIKTNVQNTNFIGGSEVNNFEIEYASYCNVKHAISCGNGTDALILALKALDIKDNDIVITVPNTFIATTEAITAVGAKIRFVEIDKNSFTMDPQSLENYLENSNDVGKIKAIIPVHLYGQMANMEEISRIAKKYNLRIIEDSAQAHGAKYKGKGPGHYGDIATYSFYPGKNLGAFGDGGAVVTNSDQLANRINMLSNHGRIKKYEHLIEGYNSRLDTIQASILRIKLTHLDSWTNLKKLKVKRYRELLSGIENIKLPIETKSFDHVYHLFVVQVENRDRVLEALKNVGISAGIHYPLPLHLQPAYKRLGYKKGDFPITENIATKALSLPLWPEITEEQINYVCQNLIRIVKEIN